MSAPAYDAELDGAVSLPLDLDADFWASCDLEELLELEAWTTMPQLSVRAAAELDGVDVRLVAWR